MAKFPPGQSGNPAGRRKGSRGRFSVAVQRLMETDAENVARAMIAAARGGDVQAGKLVLDRVAPLRRGTPIPFDLPELTTAQDVVTAISSITRQVADGVLSVEEGNLVCGMLELQRRAIETAQLEQRIAALEAKSA